MIPGGLKSTLQQAVRASVAKTKDVALRAESAAAGNATSVAPGEPVRASARIEARIADAPGAASQALRGLLASRGAVNAVVVASLGGTRYLVDIAGEQSAVVLEGASIQAERSLQAGTDVRLILATRAEDPEATNAAGRTHASLSAVGQLIGDILGPTDPAAGREPGHVRAIAAPLTQDPGNPASIASGLRAAVAESGLFYESHVQQWIEGKRPLEALAREPQTQLVRADAATTTTSTATTTAPNGREMTAIVREQLHALDTRQVAWSGPLWPGQAGEIRIGEEEPDTPREGGERIWRARLALELPSLGRVEVRLALAGDALQLGFRVAEESARNRLDADVRSLADRLDAQGLRSQASVQPADALPPADREDLG